MSRAQDRYGLKDAEYQAIWSVDGGRAFRRYERHRRGAARRGIGFELTFAEWWRIWRDSGKYDRMGTHYGEYVMARHGDLGPYAVGNVEIQLATTNSSDANLRNLGRVGMPVERIYDYSDPVLAELEDYCAAGAPGV
jgi:hypothetical protein